MDSSCFNPHNFEALPCGAGMLVNLERRPCIGSVVDTVAILAARERRDREIKAQLRTADFAEQAIIDQQQQQDQKQQDQKH
jgi:hypothetical protein